MSKSCYCKADHRIPKREMHDTGAKPSALDTKKSGSAMLADTLEDH